VKKILIIGANGAIGRMVAQKLLAQGKPVVAMIRNTDQQSYFTELGAEVVIADLEGDFRHAFTGCEKVVFTAGSGPKTGADKTLLVDLWAASRSVDYAKTFNIRQFVMVSARGAADPDLGPVSIKPYNVAKRFADQYLLDSGIPCTILRPGRLLNEQATHRFTTLRPAEPENQVITREDTADAIVYCLNHPSTIGEVAELYQGELPLSAVLTV
tara:strand:- start:1733 stop:2371 length:639 start_codon:yes stop_codon:yes gene_type:complete